jgi:hypothetical protein
MFQKIIDRTKLDRAVLLAEQAVDQVGKMRAGPVPVACTDAQWRNYLQDTEEAARNILAYVQTIRGH